MTHFSPYDCSTAEKLAARGHTFTECLGNCIVRGNSANGFTLEKSGELQGKFRTITEAMQHANILTDCATTVPVARA